jgi:hypothetical protein
MTLISGAPIRCIEVYFDFIYANNICGISLWYYFFGAFHEIDRLWLIAVSTSDEGSHGGEYVL